MPGKLLAEIRQTRPFASLEEEALLNISRTADVLAREIAALLKPHTLSSVQYNVLRILRGAGPNGAHCKDISERLVTADPDVTRLIDRLEKRGFVTRSRSGRDKRYVSVCIADDGLALLAELDAPILELSQRCLGHLEKQDLTTLIGLLERVRDTTP